MTDIPTASRIQELIAIFKRGIEQDDRDLFTVMDWSDLLEKGVITPAELNWCQTFCDVAVVVTITTAQ